MKVLALDMGSRRVGIATGDTATGMALPVTTLPAAEVFSGAATFRRIIDDHEPELLVVGLPLSLDGAEHGQAKQVRKLAERVAETTGIPVVYQDERLSSAEARRFLRDAGCTEREMRGKIDTVAASLILRAYLDAASSEWAGSSGR